MRHPSSLRHPLYQFAYCPVCGAKTFEERNEKAKHCRACGFVYYFNPSAAVACFVRNAKGEVLLVRRGKEPAKGTLDLPGGFVDMYETAEEAARREVKEETGLELRSCRYLFSLPNLYPYAGFEVHTLDLVFECEADDFSAARAADDASAIVVTRPGELCPDEFGLASIKRAVSRYQSEY